MRIFIKIAKPTIFALLLMGCAHSVEPKKPLQEKLSIAQTPVTALSHEGSKGGAYGIGEGWSIELIPATYKTVTETVISRVPNFENRVPLMPAVYEWILESTVDDRPTADKIVKLKTIPAIYETRTETIIEEVAKIEYYLTDTLYDTDGSVITPATVQLRNIPAVTIEEKRRVVVSPLRMEKYYIPAPKKEGHRLVLKTPILPLTYEHGIITKAIPRTYVAQPWRFIIRNADKELAHSFDSFEDFTAFVAGDRKQ